MKIDGGSMKGIYIYLVLLFSIALLVINNSVEAKEVSAEEGATVFNYKLLQDAASQGDSVSKLVLETSMQSMWETIVFSSAIVKMDMGKPFVCVPENLSMSGKDLRAIINTYMIRFPEKVNPEDKIGLIAILALRERFPCG